VFYICAQRELHPRTWMKEVLFLPCLLALGIGLSLNNARAVLEALINHKSDFTRTPKYGIERRSQAWRNCKYRPLISALPLAVLFGFVSITPAFALTPVDTSNQLIISVRDQKLMLVQNGGKVATYPVSTSMFGVGDYWGRMTTPLGYLAIEKKIGDNAPTGAVFHNRRLTGEVLQPNAPGRDPVITRIIWLRGLEAQNAHAFQRCIYIHGTPQEKTIGRPASYGCIRMKSSDVAALYDRVPLGTLVQITPEHLPKLAKAPRLQPTNTFAAVSAKPQSQDQTISTPASGATLSVEQMRMRGALAAQRQKAKLELDKRL